jgi:hypothetical protein
LTGIALAGLLLIAHGSVIAQTRYNPPANGRTGPPPTLPPSQTTPDPTGLTLVAMGAAAAVGYVLRVRRNAV